jgi:hypothetical protein
MKTVFVKVSFLVATLVAGSSFAAGLKPFQKEAQTFFETKVTDYREDAEKTCGTKFNLKTNFEAFKAEEWTNTASYDWCAQVFTAIKQLCEKDAYKDELVKNIKEVRCLFGGKDGSDNAKTQANMSVGGKAFTHKMHPTSSNIGDNARAVIEKALNQ